MEEGAKDRYLLLLDPVVKTLFPKWGAEPSLTGQWLPAAGWDGTWEARTGSGLVPMRCDFVTL